METKQTKLKLHKITILKGTLWSFLVNNHSSGHQNALQYFSMRYCQQLNSVFCMHNACLLPPSANTSSLKRCSITPTVVKKLQRVPLKSSLDNLYLNRNCSVNISQINILYFLMTPATDDIIKMVSVKNIKDKDNIGETDKE